MPRRGYSERASGDDILRAIGFYAARDAALTRAGLRLQSTWKEKLGSGGTGKRYEAGTAFITHGGRVFGVKGTPLNPGRSSAHTASAPGDPPAKDRGLLQQAVHVGDVEKDRLKVGMGGPRGRIGKALEYGVNVAGSQVGRHPGRNLRIDPRPHARPAANEAREAMTRAVRTVFLREIKGPRLTG